MTRHEVERRRGQVARMAASGMQAGEISHAFAEIVAKKKDGGAPAVEWAYMDVSRRTIERDIEAIREANRRRVTSLTPDEMAAQVMADYEAEHRELWVTVRSCGADPKWAHIKVGALNAIMRLRDGTLKNLSKLGVLPEDAVKDPTFRWLLSLTEAEIKRIAGMSASEAEEFLSRQAASGGLRLIS